MRGGGEEGGWTRCRRTGGTRTGTRSRANVENILNN